MGALYCLGVSAQGGAEGVGTTWNSPVQWAQDMSYVVIMSVFFCLLEKPVSMQGT